MVKKAPPVTIIEFVTQEEIDHLMESAFIEEAEAADELELELSDLSQASAFDTVLDEDPGLISNDEIESLLKGAIPLEKSAFVPAPYSVEKSGPSGAVEKAAETGDFSSMVNQSDIDALLRGGLEEFSAPKSAEGKHRSDGSGLVSPNDIDQMLKEAIADETVDGLSGGEGITQEDLDALLNDVETESEKKNDGKLLHSSVEDAFLSGASESAEIEPVFPPKAPGEGGDILSQADLDSLLMAEIGGVKDAGPAEAKETIAEGGPAKQKGVVSQSAIDERLAKGLIPGSETKSPRAPEPVILAADSAKAEASSVSTGSSSWTRLWYDKRVFQFSAAAVLLLALSTVGLLKWWPSKSPALQPIVLHFPIPGPDAKAPALAEPLRTDIFLQGFLILAPIEQKGLTGLSTDVLLGFTDSAMTDTIKGKESFIRNIIYGVLNSALKSAGDKPPSEADMIIAIREAMERVVPKEAIRSVLLDKFEAI